MDDFNELKDFAVTVGPRRPAPYGWGVVTAHPSTRTPGLVGAVFAAACRGEDAYALVAAHFPYGSEHRYFYPTSSQEDAEALVKSLRLGADLDEIPDAPVEVDPDAIADYWESMD